MKGTGRPTFGGPDELEVGQVVYLYPNTRSASPNVHRMLVVRVAADPKPTWPLVQVEWEEGEETKTERVHQHNLRSRPHTLAKKKEQRQGDAVGSDDDDGAKVRKMGNPIPLIDPATGYEDVALF